MRRWPPRSTGCAAMHGEVVLYDCHSIRSVLPRLFDGDAAGLQPRHQRRRRPADPALQALVEPRSWPTAAISHVINGRFKGGWTTRHYGQPARRRPRHPDGTRQPRLPARAERHAVAPDNWPRAYDADVRRTDARHPRPNPASCASTWRADTSLLEGDNHDPILATTSASSAPPRGTELTAKSWLTEAPLRMLMNNLDPDVAENPNELVVYGGIGRAARDWEDFDRIVATLKTLEDDETLLVQSGKPVGVFRTHADAPRVLIANSNLVPHWATWDHFNELDRKGLMMYGQMTAGSWIYIGTQGIVQGTYETFVEVGRQHYGGDLKGKWILTAGLGGMGGAQPLAAVMAGASLPRHRMPAELASISACAPAISTCKAETLDEALAMIERWTKAGEGDLGRPARQCRRDLARNCSGAASGPTWSPTRPRRTTRSTAICRRAGRSPNGARSASSDPEGGREGRARVDGASMSRPCSTSGTPACRRSTTATTSARWRKEEGVENAFAFPGFVPAYIRPLFCRGIGPFRWAALSGDPEDIYKTDAKVKELMPGNTHLHNWLDMARERIAFQGLPARICWVGLGDRHRLGLAFNEMVANGELKAPIVIGRDHLDSGSVASPNRETEAMKDGSDAVSDWPLLNALLNTASGATWVSLHHGGGVGMGFSQHAGMVIVADGTRGRGAAPRARAVERPGDRRHAPRRCRLRHRHRLRQGAPAQPARHSGLSAMRILRAADYRDMPWKNGGGDDDRDRRFARRRRARRFRLAHLDGACRGRRAVLAVCRRRPHAGRAGRRGHRARHCRTADPVELTAASAPLSFPADVATTAALIAGPITDLNVMTRRGRVTPYGRAPADLGADRYPADDRNDRLFCRSTARSA